jgi:hypothetical protein
MPIDGPIAHHGQLVEAQRIARDHPREIHHLRQTEHPAITEQRLDVQGGQVGPATFEMRRGHARTDHRVHVDGTILARAEHEANAFGAHHIGDFVRIGDDGGGAVGGDHLGEFRNGEHRRFNMHVPVDETGTDELPAQVERLTPSIRADAGDAPVGDGHVALVDLAREHVDDLPAAQHQIGRGSTGGDVDQVFSVHGFAFSRRE